MSSEPIIAARNLGKCYQLYARPQDRLKQFLARGRRQYFREFWALRDVSFDIMPGEVVGIVGRNGSGKSTLLQLICNTLTPTAGEVTVNGRIAALLELGAGFNPEFSGRENVFMSAAIMGISEAEIAARYDEIVEFSGIRDFIDQPVKTYSSGMYVRLAFSVATSVEPDILVIDEALSVGDGEFARRSFERIMALKRAGKTILFCSHSMYQVEALCDRALWLAHGRVAADGEPAQVVAAYGAALVAAADAAPAAARPAQPGGPRVVAAAVSVDGATGRKLAARSGEATLAVRVRFESDAAEPAPTVAVCITGADRRIIASAGSHNDGFAIRRDADGRGEASVAFDRLALLKGHYGIDIYLLCENGIHVYDQALSVAELELTQAGLEQGLVSLPHRWEQAEHAVPTE